MRRFFLTVAILVLILAYLALSGCAAHPTLQPVNVAVPVACDQVVPVRPQMPTEGLAPGVKLFDFVKAAQAEILRREGYELELRTALEACVTPVAPR